MSDFHFIKKEPVTKGMSGDKKFRVTCPDGARFLLRISDSDKYERKKAEFEMMQKAFENGVPVSRPVEFGIYEEDGSVYQLTEWCEGKDLEELLPGLPDTKSYALGFKAGCVLAAVHAIEAPANAEIWRIRFERKIRTRLEHIAENLTFTEEIGFLARYLNENIALLDNRPQCFHHGDYNPGNLIVSADGTLALIDFNSYNAGYGEPWFELSNIFWDDEINSRFKAGVIRGYFKGTPPPDFLLLMSYYYAYDALAQLCECDETGEDGAKARQDIKKAVKWIAAK